MNLDKKRVSKIFNILRQGAFLSANSPNKEERNLFEYVYRHYDSLREYFSYIDIELKLKNQYCYFSSFTSKEQKLNTILELIDIISFLFEIEPSFDVGYRFYVNDIFNKIKDDVVLLKKIDKIKTLNQETLESKINSLILKLEKKGFIAIENEYLKRYVVLNSFEYLIQFFDKVEIK